jgi:hypothetical protein
MGARLDPETHALDSGLPPVDFLDRDGRNALGCITEMGDHLHFAVFSCADRHWHEAGQQQHDCEYFSH